MSAGYVLRLMRDRLEPGGRLSLPPVNRVLYVVEGQLSIEGHQAGSAEGAALAAEFRPLDYRRTFAVPQGIDADKITADMTAGVLRVHLPKAAALKPRQIQVRAS